MVLSSFLLVFPFISFGRTSEECLNCHGSEIARTTYRGKKGTLLPVDSKKLAVSVHRGLSCENCHPEAIQVPHSKKMKAVICETCHTEKPKKSLVKSVHASIPSYESCHGMHDIQAKKTFSSAGCASCHPEPGNAYQRGVHGLSQRAGQREAACCQDCHGGHDIQRKGDPRSLVYPLHLPRTCAQYYAHADYRNREKYSILFYTDRFMVLLLLFTFSLFGVHTFLWLLRSLRDRLNRRKEKMPTAEKKEKEREVYYLRLSLFHGLMHVLGILCFMGLVLTGMPLNFSYSPLLQKIAPYPKGFQAAGFVHRICALFTFFYLGLHLVFLAFLHFRKNQKASSGDRIPWCPNWRTLKTYSAISAGSWGWVPGPSSVGSLTGRNSITGLSSVVCP